MREYTAEDMKAFREFVKQKHHGQKRRQGSPYYEHPWAVAAILAEKGFDYRYQLTALFHDLLEDSDITVKEIEEQSDIQIAEAVVLLTKEQGYSMPEYINRIKRNELAKAVKLDDRLHNLSEAGVTDLAFQRKYIEETKTWYLPLAKATVFAEEIDSALKRLMDIINKQMKEEKK